MIVSSLVLYLRVVASEARSDSRSKKLADFLIWKMLDVACVKLRWNSFLTGIGPAKPALLAVVDISE